MEQASNAPAASVESFDAIVIGAGVSGLYQLYKLRELGLKVRCLEDGGGVGGTWYWNRYPGCRFDSESETYGYSFSKELLQEWNWKEHYSGQPENERYLNYAADKFDLRRDIQFNAHVISAVFDEKTNQWEVGLENGQRMRAQFVVAAVGILSARNIPKFEGIESFKGLSYHTSRWPKERVDFTGKRVAVIGTGATAVQLIPIIAKEVGHLTVFQRTRTIARRSGIHSSTRKLNNASRRPTQRFTRGSAKLAAASFTTSIGARQSMSRARNGSRSTNNCGRNPGSRNGSATS
jgi:cation diffusion facilitator CzcD-associated flavoprotein CzcO